MTNQDSLAEARRMIVEYSLKMLKDDLTRGALGNISVLVGERLLAVSPSGVDYDQMSPQDVPLVDFDGRIVEGALRPSSETQMHISIYERRPDVRAIVHTHSPYATAFSINGEPIPAVHYVVGRLGGDVIPVTSRYELFGSPELAQATVDALGASYSGVLLRNHGAVAIGSTLASAYSGALNIESMAQLALLSRLVGQPNVLSAAQVDEAIQQFKNHGQKK
ncbi:MAG: class II aldolase/adducin family protein [Propionibacteriaceae bacterium]|jgi:L-fuculose-phosphate aldolase|nr:class II aldolase/adducin family protein [Propionibacteriaceae bacterium]